MSKDKDEELEDKRESSTSQRLIEKIHHTDKVIGVIKETVKRSFHKNRPTTLISQTKPSNINEDLEDDS